LEKHDQREPKQQVMLRSQNKRFGFYIPPIIPLRSFAQTGYAMADRLTQKTATLNYAPEEKFLSLAPSVRD
jgi:hypothetical protein